MAGALEVLAKEHSWGIMHSRDGDIHYVGRNTPKSGAKYNYNSSNVDALQNACNAVRDGDIIWLESDEYYGRATVSLNIPSTAKNITVQPWNWESLPISSKTDVEESDLGTLPTIRNPRSTIRAYGSGAIVDARSPFERWTFRGIDFHHLWEESNDLYGPFAGLIIGDWTTTQASSLPTNIIFDRCAFRAAGGNNPGPIHGIYSSTRGCAFLGCAWWDSKVKIGVYQETHPFLSYNSVGPYLFENCNFHSPGFLFFGGSYRKLSESGNMAVNGVTVRNCHFQRKWEHWCWGNSIYGVTVEAQPYSWAAKGFIEFKNGENILIEGNVFERSWLSWDVGQKGACIVTTGTSEGATYGLIRNITFRNNIAFNVNSFVTAPGGNLTEAESPQPPNGYGPVGDPGYAIFHNNLVYRCDKKFGWYITNPDQYKYTHGHGFGITRGRDQELTFTNNAIWGDGEEDVQPGWTETRFNAGALLIESMNNLDGLPSEDADKHEHAVIENNIIRGIVWGSGLSDGKATMDRHFRSYSFTKNLFCLSYAEDALRIYSALGNWTTDVPTNVTSQFPGDWRNGDMRLSPSSLYYTGNSRCGTDGNSLGPDYSALYTAVGSRLWPLDFTP